MGTGTVFAFMLGGLWYSRRLFGVRWAEGVGIEPRNGHPAPALVAQLLGTLLLSWLIAISVVISTLALPLLVIATSAVLLAASGFFGQKTPYAIATESGFVVANGFIMLLCQALF